MSDAPVVMEASNRAKRLRRDLRRALRDVRNAPSDLWVQGHPSELAWQVPNCDRLLRLLDELDKKLIGTDVPEGTPRLSPGEFWSLGSVEMKAGPPRWVPGGYVQPILRVPLPAPVSTPVVHFLTIDGDADLLKRETHSHFGWHYHFLNWKRERSDRILCWDVRALLADGEDQVVFQEPHAEGGGFKARPHLWKAAKREAMHKACRPDLRVWLPSTFKQASNDAELVWPDGKRLTPHASRLAKASRGPPKS